MSPRLYRVFAALLLAAFAWLALGQTARVGLTFDEPAHLAAGRAYNATGDFRLHAENGLFPQRWAALAAAWTEAPAPEFSGAAWEGGDVWGVARAWLFAPGQDTRTIVRPARALIAVLALALLAAIWRWSAALWGERGGLLSLALAAFCPHLLAHGALVTSDTAAALGFAVALLAWWRLLHRITPGRVLMAGAATAFVALAKFSGVLLAPVVLGLLVVRLARGGGLVIAADGRRRGVRGARSAAWLGGATLAAGLLGWLGVWAGYSFRYAAAPDGREARFAQSWEEVLLTTPRTGGSVMADGSRPEVVELRAGIVQHFVSFARAHRLLPESWLYGLAFADRFSRHRLAYFSGESRESGWLGFFPAAFALKTTLPALGLGILGVLAIARARRWRRWIYRLVPLIAFVGIYAAFALTSSLNIGHRHLLPVYPLLYLFAGAAVATPRSRFATALVLALVSWHGVEAWRVRPHFLTYFNQLAGGPAGGSRFLVDSSLDWGQGLPDLKAWLAAHAGDEPLYLSYFGSDDPVHSGIRAVRFGDIYFDYSATRAVVPELGGGLYAVSATMLRRVYTRVRGAWSADYEAAYQRLRDWAIHATNWPAGVALDENGHRLEPDALRERLSAFEQLRFGRLCHFLEKRAPDAIVANSIYVYRLSDADVAQALEAPLPGR